MQRRVVGATHRARAAHALLADVADVGQCAQVGFNVNWIVHAPKESNLHARVISLGIFDFRGLKFDSFVMLKIEHGEFIEFFN